MLLDIFINIRLLLEAVIYIITIFYIIILYVMINNKDSNTTIIITFIFIHFQKIIYCNINIKKSAIINTFIAMNKYIAIETRC